MDLMIPIIFLIFGILAFLIGLMEELNEKRNEDDETRSSHFVWIMLLIALILFIIGGVCFRGVTSQYYSPSADTIETVYESQYIAFSWLGYGLAFFVGYFFVMKSWELLDLWMPEV